MGFWDKIFVEVIEWVDDSSDTVVWKFPDSDKEIKNGAQLIVREGQAAVFLHEGTIGDIFLPGRHVLETKNIPILTNLASFKYGFNSPFKCDVFFVNTHQYTDLKWGTQNPIMLRDPEFGPLRLRAFGSYCFQVEEPGQFVQQISGSDSFFTTKEIVGQFRNMLSSRFADALGEAKIPALDLAANYDEIGDRLYGKIQEEFNEYGVKLTKFLVENISLPESVEKALDKRAEMGMIGNLDNYTKYQTAEAIREMAQNPGDGSNMMGVFAGMNMGGAMGQTMGNSMNQATAPAASAPPPLPQTKVWFAGINGQQAGPFDTNDLQSKITGAEIGRDTLLWKNGMTAWEKAANIPELSNLFGAAPPPLPPF